jgi:hypothetical protein
MKTIGYIFAAILFVFGFLFALSAFSAASPNPVARLVGGLILFGLGALIIWLMKKEKVKVLPPEETIIKQQVELSGNVKLDELKCKQCGGALSKDNVHVAAGAVMISCPYCNSQYQITEEPKW